MGKLRPFVRKDSYMPNKKWIPFVIGNGYTTTDGASGPAPEYETVTGNPVSFNAITPFPLRQLEVAFSPVQDLHGYDSPWPAGGGKNKLGAKDSFNVPFAQQGVTLSAQKDTSEFTMTGTLSGPLGYRASDHYKTTLSAGTYTFSCDVEASGTEGLFIYDVDTSTIIARSNKNASGSFTLAEETTISLGINFPTTIAAGTFHIQLEAGSSATSYSPYSNLCPISGWDSLNVEQRGKNLFDKDSAQIADGWWSVTDCTVGEPLPNYAASGNYHTSAPIPVVAGQTYSVVGCGGLNGSFLYLDKDMNYLDGFANASYSSRTFTVPNNLSIAYLRFPFSTATVDTCQLELGSTASAYTPYS